MRKRKKRSPTLLLLATLILSTLFFSAINCRHSKPEIILIGEARVIQRLPSGNWEVTPALIVLLADMQAEVKTLRLEIRRLMELVEK